MPAPTTLYQELSHLLCEVALQAGLPKSTVQRLAILVTGIIAAKSAVLSKVAQELHSLALSDAIAESIERRLGRTLHDSHLISVPFYPLLLRQFINWEQLREEGRLVLVIDESSKKDKLHLFRVSLAYHGRAIPLAWAVWPQNVKLPDGAYWQAVDKVLAIVAKMLPVGIEVVVTADRAYDIPPFIDRLSAFGWHYVIRAKLETSTRFLSPQGWEIAFGEVVRQHVDKPGMCWRGRGKLFKAAGWREVSIVAMWAVGEKEPLVVLTDLKPRWEALTIYDRRFWIEPGFRDDKSKGWQWEDSQVEGPEHNERLLLGMAIATLVTLCLGAQEAKARLERLQARRVRPGAKVGQARHAKQSLFTMGLYQAKKWLYGNLKPLGSWLLINLGTGSWYHIWHVRQFCRFIFHSSVRP